MCPIFEICQHRKMVWVGRVRENAELSRIGAKFLQDLQILGKNFWPNTVRQTRDITAWTRKARYQATLNGIVEAYPDNRDCFRGMFSCQGSGSSRRRDHVHLGVN